MKATIDQKVQQFCKEYRIPGIAIQVAEGGELIYEAYEGYRDVAKEIPVNADTIFGIASLTKSFTTLAIMMLQEEGKISIEDQVVKWLPSLTYIQPATTIHHLMTHSAGYTGLMAFHRARYASILKDPHRALLFHTPIQADQANVKTVSDMITVMNEDEHIFIGEPGEKFNYSNESYALLQGICEKASGMDFKDFVEAYILRPLKMDRTFFTLEEIREYDNVTEIYAYTKDGDQDVFHSPAWWDSGEIYSAGALKSTVHDMMAYMELYRKEGIVDGKELVSKESLKDMMDIHISTPHGIHYGYGLLTVDINGMSLVGHGGGIKGVSSFMGMIKEAGLTITILTNIADFPTELLAKTILETILEIEGEEAPAPLHLDVQEMKAYIGVYDSGEGQTVEVTIEDGQLFLWMQGESFLMEKVGADLFRLFNGRQIAFERGERGKVDGMYRGMRYMKKIEDF